MKNLEIILDKYFENNTCILLATLTVIILLITINVAKIINSKIKFKIYPLLEKIYLSFIIAAISVALPFINFKLEIKYAYFNILFFAVYMLFIIIYIVIHILKHKEYVSILAHCITYIPIAIWFQFFLLGVSKNLQLLEFINGLAAICLVEIMQTILIEKSKRAPEPKPIESGYPNKDLYGTRIKQFERFITILEQQKKEPYAIMISSEWGTGKTSFIEALQDELSTDAFILIEAGGEKNASEIMKDISNELIRILNDNNIYIEKSGLIENYFLSFTQLLENVGWGFFNKLTETLGIRPKETNTRKYVNSKLEKLNKTIFLIIDDLDRCDNEYRMKMFKVIRESTELTNCKTIFLADDSMFMTDDCDVNYIEKYISYNLRLCKVEYEEIVAYHIISMFDKNFYESIDNQVLHELSLTDIQQEIMFYPNKMLKTLNRELQDEKNSEIIEQINSAIYKIEKNITNSRKVKNYLNGIRNNLIHLNNIWGPTLNEYKNENWVDSILRAEFVKHFLPNDYMQMMEHSNIWSYRRHGGIPINVILFENSDFSKKMQTLNYTFYKLDTLDFSKDKTEHQTCLDELRGLTPNILHFEEYLRYMSCLNNYSDYDILLQLYEKSCELTSEQELRFFQQLLHNISIYQIPVTKDYLKLSKRIANSFAYIEWPENSFNTLNANIKSIVDTCIASNNLTLKKPLYITYGYTYIEENWGSSVSDIKELYNALIRIDPDFKYDSTNNQMEHLYFIQRYYRHSKDYFIMKAHNSTPPDIDVDELFSKCDLLFHICQVWLEATYSRLLDNHKKKGKKYFDAQLLIWDKRAFSNVENLNIALDNYKKHIKSSNNVHPSDNAILFQDVVIKMLNILSKTPEWFEGQEHAFADKLHTIMGLVCQLNSNENSVDNEMFETLKILVYSFRESTFH